MGVCPSRFSSVLHLEKHLQFHHRAALSGDGWAFSITTCLCTSINAFFFRAKLPQSKKTNRFGWCEDKWAMTALVNYCQPQLAWELAQCAYTVSVAFNMSIPWPAQLCKYPWDGMVKPGMSLCNYLYMFIRLGGGVTPGRTEKHKPCAWPGLWYGSCPNKITFSY